MCRKGNRKIKHECVCKPGSVLNSHLSWQSVTRACSMPPPRDTPSKRICPSTVLLQIGFTRQSGLPPSGELLPHLSILTRKIGRLFSVALALGSPPAAVSRYYRSVKPGLSSHRSFRILPAAVRRTRIIIIYQITRNVKYFDFSLANQLYLVYNTVG